MKKIYFLCSKDANKAQIVSGFVQTYLASHFHCKVTCYQEEESMLDHTVSIMREIGIDIRQYEPATFDINFFETADYIVTVCENNTFSSAMLPKNATHIHIQFEEPLIYSDYFLQLKSFHLVRDQIGVIIKELATSIMQTELNKKKSPL